MRRPSALIVLLAATSLPHAPAHAASFDGKWSVTQECEPAPGGARAFKWLYDANVTNGVLVGQYGEKDKPSSLTLTGRIQADGTAMLMASGFSGRAEYTLGFPQPGEKFSYPVSARFEATRGTGVRTQGRTCRFSFVKV
jgi:hypothetical protein